MNEVTRKKLDFDSIANHVSGFCLSDMGRDKLVTAEPLHDRSWLETELQRVLELRLFIEEGLPLPFSSLPDTRPVLRKLEMIDSSLDPFELLAVHDLLLASAQLRKFLFRNRETYPAVNGLTIQLWLEKSLQYAIMRAVDGQGRVRDTASDGLLAIRADLSSGRARLRTKMERLQKRCQANGWLMEDTVAMKNGKLVLGLKVEYRYKLPGFIQDYSQTGQTVFIEPAETLEMSNRIQELEIDERREIERILRELSSLVGEELENIRHNQSLMAVFDSLYARARFAADTSSVLPSLSEGRLLRIVRGFNPWLLVTHRKKGRQVFPLDMELSGAERALVISGPNAGGKSVAMKTVGLLCCMLQHGYLVPCSESSVFPLFDGIHIEIGDEQSIENDLSTFSSHLEQVRGILVLATSRSLVLIDELCSGTDVEEGGAIARAVIEELLARGSTLFVTTHLGSLKAYAHEREGAVNGAMEFDRESLSPSFRFLKGLPGSSFAFAMVRRMGFGDDFLRTAERFLHGKTADLDGVLDDLRAVLEENRRLKGSLERERAELAEEGRRLRKTADEIDRRHLSMKTERARELRREIEEAKKAIREIVREVREHPEREAVEKGRRKLDLHKKELLKEEAVARQETTGVPEGDAAPRKGDLVRVLSTRTTGEVVALQEKEATVQCGAFRLTTSLENLEKISRRGAKELSRDDQARHSGGGWSSRVGSLESTTLDLRGMTGDEAVSAIERFIDRLILNRMRQGTIIHGKGSGALRRRVSVCLKQHPAVREFRIGDWAEGGSGVTIIEL
ncbi:endonuclease MutS2 [Prosthecochloris sp. GSB1]|uniref:endonuclease MutS2 n=1 Tax=Prosthecochloris sp. GSB1 TaxID=281093 RepID=UPI000B8D0A57|nr:Smr/MutS family protein [Prosthecochloris sp. GSB1]ASQ89992.1 endonuclease MutS2 [Prosthecochloris sp. GSB1]